VFREIGARIWAKLDAEAGAKAMPKIVVQ
jgi:hypothetical protein